MRNFRKFAKDLPKVTSVTLEFGPYKSLTEGPRRRLESQRKWAYLIPLVALSWLGPCSHVLRDSSAGRPRETIQEKGDQRVKIQSHADSPAPDALV